MSPEKLTIREMIAATGSERRRRMMAELMKWIQDYGYVDYEIVVHNLSPDRDAGVEESDSSVATVVAWEKALVVALCLGILEKDDVPEELMNQWQHVIRIIGPSQLSDNHKEVKTTIFGGDVVTTVRGDHEGAEDRELLKVERDLAGKNPDEQVDILVKDKAEIKKLYCSASGFFVTYNIGIALLSNDEVGDKRGVVAGWEVMIKFKPLPEEIIDKAYEITPEGQKVGSAFQVGPRVDLASLASTRDVDGNYPYLDNDFGVWVKNVNQPDDQPKPIQVEVMKGLVVGGLLPPHLCLELLAALDNQVPKGEKPLEPVQIKLDIDAASMIEQFKPVLDNVRIEQVGDSKVIQFPDKKDPKITTGISLDEEGKLTHFGELGLKVAILRLVDDDATMADAAMKYLLDKLGL